MKKNILFIVWILSLSLSSAFSQYVSPGNYESLNLEDLVATSNGVVSLENGSYFFNNDVTIAATDTLHIITDETLKIHAGILWTIEGVLIVQPPNSFNVSKVENEANFKGIRFDNSSESIVDKMNISACGGIKLVDSDMTFMHCDFTGFGQENTTAVIDLFHSNPLIQNCNFEINAGPAIASAANGSSSPQIIDNTIAANVTLNSNTPQINLGTSDGFTPILIDNNIILGEYSMAGGIAVATLAGGSATAIISNNDIQNNRYGIALIGNNISTEIFQNIIIGNNIQGDPMQGGSGINFYGGNTNVSVVSYNTILDNLWGITIQLNAQPNMGDGTDESPGHNKIYGNINNFQEYDLYNNTPDDIQALNNFWGTTDLDEAESFIFHHVDDASLGTVFFDPMWVNPVGLEENTNANSFILSPNPCQHKFQIEYKQIFEYEIINIAGQVINRGNSGSGTFVQIDAKSYKEGVYLVKIMNQNSYLIKKIVVQ